ncbi:origin recognition complex, subunit 6 [Elsinoe ampelina]|uniref:Origin recognition complex, subunit 6 n=1 Tax=Elsinoe ampelina TaxID=302913 RepID=A0A6A6GMZ4_9PEZI|nr:origin recognition complex, subunit 6 [Elsinoe ampelina]
MPSAVEQALVTLVPSVNNLPIELTSLANALLMQSRSKAAKLKPDEEIARTYVCSHIACERLKSRLGLEIQPRPPVPPRVYKKLKAFFDKQLDVPSTPSAVRQVDALNRSGADSSRKATPASNRSAVTPSSRKRLRDTQDDTPSKTPAGVVLPETGGDDADTPSRRSEKRARPSSAKDLAELAAGATKSPNRKSGRLFAPSPNKQNAPPEWVDDMIARLANKFEAPAATHIRAGLDHVLAVRGFSIEDALDATSSTSKSRKTKAKEPAPHEGSGIITPLRLPALLIILTLFVVGKQKGWRLTNQDQFAAKQDTGLEAIREMEEGWAPEEEALQADLEGFLAAAGEEGWMNAEWFQHVTPEDDLDKMDVDDEVTTRGRKKMPNKTPLRRKEKHAPRPTANADEDDDEDTAAGLQVGLGTMFQDAIDWLSDDRREEYREWKAGILHRLDELEGVPSTNSSRKRTSRPVVSAA